MRMYFYGLSHSYMKCIAVSCLLFISASCLVSCSGDDAHTDTGIHSTKPEPVIVITDIVKPNARALYDKFMTEILLNAIASTNTNARYLKQQNPNPDSTWTYMLIIPASASGSNYSVTAILRKKYSAEKAAEYESIYRSCLKTPSVVCNQISLL